MKFLVAHISFVPLVQKKLIPHDFDGKPIQLAEKLLIQNVHFTRTKTRYHVSIIFDNFTVDEKQRLLAGKIGIDKETQLPKHDEKGFHKDIDKISPFVDFLWDSEDQFILVEKNASVFNNYEYVFNSIQSHLGNLLEPYGWGVFVEPITERKDFWEAYSRFNSIYEVTFELHMPNLFGNTQKELAASLQDSNKRFNTTSVSQTLSNTEGKLHLDKKDSLIETLLSWITNGAGWWAINGKKGAREKKEKVTSKRSATIKTEDIAVELENYSVEDIKSIIQNVKPKLVALREPIIEKKKDDKITVTSKKKKTQKIKK